MKVGFDVDISEMSTKDLREFYMKRARKADDRLRSLEKISTQKDFKTATQWAYARAMKDIAHWSGEEGKRFKRDIPENRQQLIAKLHDVENFLASDTSSKQRIVRVYKQKADTFNKNFGTNFTWQQLGNFFERGSAEALARQFGSKTAFKAVAAIQKSPKQIKKAIKEGSDAVIRTGDAKVDEAIEAILADSGIALDDLF